MTKINFAVIGCGALALDQHIPNIAASQRAVLHTCCDLDDKSLEICKNVHGAIHISKDYQEVINNPEVQVICIATTEKMRLPLIRAAAEAGKPVYCEKPLGRTLNEIYQIQKIVKDSSIPFCVGHNRRCSPAMMDARKIFREHMSKPQAACAWRLDREGDRRPALNEDGVAGMLVRINDDWHSWKGHSLDKNNSPYGPMLFEMTHFTDLCNFFLASEAEEVLAYESGILNHSVIIKYKTGELATIVMCDNGTFAYPKELYEMYGNGGAVIVDHMLEVRTAAINDAPSRIVYPMRYDRFPDIGKEGGMLGWLEKKRVACKDAAENENPWLQFGAEPDKGHSHAIERFIDEIEGGESIVCGIDDAVMATRIAFAAVTSAKERRIVKIEEV